MYCFTAYLNLANSSPQAIKNFGCYFSNAIFNDGTSWNLDYLNPQIENTSFFIDDTLNWQKFETSYLATGNEVYITLGNFNNTANTIAYTIHNNPSPHYSYINIDDISIVEIIPANAGNDTAICSGNVATIGGLPTFATTYNWYAINGSGNASIDSTGIAKPHVKPTVTTTYVMQKTQCSAITYDTVVVTVNCVGIKSDIYNLQSKIKIYPNPTIEMLNVDISTALNVTMLNEKETTLTIENTLGQEIYKTEIKNSQSEINTSSLDAGIYLLKLYKGKELFATKKIIKE